VGHFARETSGKSARFFCVIIIVVIVIIICFFVTVIIISVVVIFVCNSSLAFATCGRYNAPWLDSCHSRADA